jgi:hypothetical protein
VANVIRILCVLSQQKQLKKAPYIHVCIAIESKKEERIKGKKEAVIGRTCYN